MAKKIFKLTLIFLMSIFIFYLFFNLDIKEENSIRNIHVDVLKDDESNTLELPLGSTFEDVKEKITINNNELYQISDDFVLYDGQSIIIDSNTSKISINKANINELITLKGIGEKTANKIIEYRQNNGAFKCIEDIKNVSGIGDKKYENIKEFISI